MSYCNSMEFGDGKDTNFNQKDYLEYLSEPRNLKAKQGSDTRLNPGLPPNPLPIWTTWPLDHKLPMISGPKSSVQLFTTKLGETEHKRPSGLAFDLMDPYNILMSNCYKPLHDPHLKPKLYTPHMRNRLIQNGFITKDGKVLCTLREFNEYRQYLRKVNLLLEKEEQQERGEPSIPKMLRPESESAAIQRERAKRVHEVRSRLSEQQEKDRTRYLELRAQEDERQKRLREHRMANMTEKARAVREQEVQRHATLVRRQQQERRRKAEMLRGWLEEDRERQARSEAHRREEQRLQQRKLQESWALRQSVQERRLGESEKRHSQAEVEKQRKIERQNEFIRQQWERQQAVNSSLLQKQRRERNEAEARYRRQLERRRRQLAARPGGSKVGAPVCGTSARV